MNKNREEFVTPSRDPLFHPAIPRSLSDSAVHAPRTRRKSSQATQVPSLAQMISTQEQNIRERLNSASSSNNLTTSTPKPVRKIAQRKQTPSKTRQRSISKRRAESESSNGKTKESNYLNSRPKLSDAGSATTQENIVTNGLMYSHVKPKFIAYNAHNSALRAQNHNHLMCYIINRLQPRRLVIILLLLLAAILTYKLDKNINMKFPVFFSHEPVQKSKKEVSEAVSDKQCENSTDHTKTNIDSKILDSLAQKIDALNLKIRSLERIPESNQIAKKRPMVDLAAKNLNIKILEFNSNPKFASKGKMKIFGLDIFTVVIPPMTIFDANSPECLMFSKHSPSIFFSISQSFNPLVLGLNFDLMKSQLKNNTKITFNLDLCTDSSKNLCETHFHYSGLIKSQYLQLSCLNDRNNKNLKYQKLYFLLKFDFEKPHNVTESICLQKLFIFTDDQFYFI